MEHYIIHFTELSNENHGWRPDCWLLTALFCRRLRLNLCDLKSSDSITMTWTPVVGWMTTLFVTVFFFFSHGLRLLWRLGWSNFCRRGRLIPYGYFVVVAWIPLLVTRYALLCSLLPALCSILSTLCSLLNCSSLSAALLCSALLAADSWLLTSVCQTTDRWLLITGFWLLTSDYWPLTVLFPPSSAFYCYSPLLLSTAARYCYSVSSALCSLLATLCSLLATRRSLLAARYSLLSILCSLLSAPLLSALCSLLSALCSLLSALCSLLSALCSLLSALCSLLSALCSLLARTRSSKQGCSWNPQLESRTGRPHWLILCYSVGRGSFRTAAFARVSPHRATLFALSYLPRIIHSFCDLHLTDLHESKHGLRTHVRGIWDRTSFCVFLKMSWRASHF